MFRKLLQKVEGSESPEAGSSPDLGRRGSSLRRGSARNLQRTDSLASISSSEEAQTKALSKEELARALLDRTSQVKRLEVRLADYERSLKECTKERDKLMTTLELQQDTAMQKISAMEKNFSAQKKEMNNVIDNLKKDKNELMVMTDKLRNDNRDLLLSVTEWKEKSTTCERNQEDFFAKCENNEELRDFQMQELAKVKHMLMNSEKECKVQQEELEKRLKDLNHSRKVNTEIEASLRSTTESLNLIRKQLEAQIECNKELENKNEGQVRAILTLTKENSSLSMEVERLNSGETGCLGENTQDPEKSGKEDARWQLMENKLQEASKESSHYARQVEEAQTKLTGVNSKLEEVTHQLDEAKKKLDEKHHEITDLQKKQAMENLETEKRIEHMMSTLQSREVGLMECKEEIATLRNHQTEESEEVSSLTAEKTRLEEKLVERDRSIKLQQQRLNDLKKALNKELTKRSTSQMNGSGNSEGQRDTQNYHAPPGLLNSSEASLSDISMLGSSDDPNMGLQQGEITVKYLKHVFLSFLSCGQSEAQQLIKALGMLLHFNREEENYVREFLEYRTSWFGSKPSTKKVVRSSVKQGRR